MRRIVIAVVVSFAFFAPLRAHAAVHYVCTWTQNGQTVTAGVNGDTLEDRYEGYYAQYGAECTGD